METYSKFKRVQKICALTQVFFQTLSNFGNHYLSVIIILLMFKKFVVGISGYHVRLKSTKHKCRLKCPNIVYWLFRNYYRMLKQVSAKFFNTSRQTFSRCFNACRHTCTGLENSQEYGNLFVFQSNIANKYTT